MNIQFDPTISMDTVISVVATLVTIAGSVIGGIYALSTNTKKHELTVAYKSELLGWYEKTVGILTRVIHLHENGLWNQSGQTKVELLADLSAQIEIGRFYFPNALEAGEKFGADKHTAYQGYRQIVLDHLLDFYRAAYSGIASVPSLWLLERKFTSFVFDIIDPREQNRAYCKHTGIRLPEPKSKEAFLEEHPEYASQK